MEESNKNYTHSGNSSYISGNENYVSGNSNYMSGNSNYMSGNGNYMSGNGNYAYYGNGMYGNQQYGNMQYGNQQYNYGGNNYGNYADPNQQDEGSDFNAIEWLFRILHYWYLFVIGAVLALGLSMLQNRKWLPAYYSQGTIIIKETMGYGGASTSALMQGFGVDASYKNVNNQVIMLGSYDLMCRVVDSLPFLQTEYLTQGRFRTRNLYHQTPIVVESESIDAHSFGMMFEVDFLKDGSLRVSSANEDLPFETITHYGELIDCSFFKARIWPTQQMVSSGKVFFRFRTQESLVSEFMGRLQLNFVGTGSTVLALALISETPERDCEFLDKLAQIYLLQNLEQKNEVADNSIRFINEQLDNLQQSLEVSEGAMTDFRQQNKFVDVSAYAGTLMSKIAGYDQQNMALRLKETYLDYLTNYLSTNIESGAVIAPSSLGLNEPMLMTLVEQLNDLRLQRGELTERNVYYAKYTKDIENVKTTIHEVVNSMRASLEIEKQDLKDRYVEVERDIQRLPEKELQMVAIERNYRIDDNYYTFFLQKRAEAEIQKASNTPDNTILDKARTTAVMNPKAKRKTTTTYLAIGLLLPLILVVTSELMNNKVRTPKDMQRLSVFHQIGTVRHAKSQNPTLVRDNPRSSYAEMLRAIRTRLEFITKRKDKIVLLVTSTESGDGKTFLSSNMASLYAMTGRRTILVDMDVRKPNLHTKLGLSKGKGVTNYIIGDCELDDIIETNTPFGFHFMRAGSIPPNPGELIHSDKMTDMINTLRERYDYIIIDTSPIGLVPDAYALIEQTDVCLYVVRCMQTSRSFCQQTLEQIADVVENKDKVQLVLSDIPTEGHNAYRYGYGYGSGYGYGYGYGHMSKYGKYGKYVGYKTKKVHNYYSDSEEDDEEKEEKKSKKS